MSGLKNHMHSEQDETEALESLRITFTYVFGNHTSHELFQHVSSIHPFVR